MVTGDQSRLKKIITNGIATEEFDYDVEGRPNKQTVTLINRQDYPMVTETIYDSLDRITDVRYPAQYGVGSAERRVVHHDYDIASRINGLSVDGTSYASDLVYNAADKPTEIKVGPQGICQTSESYTYDSQTGLLVNKKMIRGSTALLDLSYGYNLNDSSTAKTGHLTRITNNLNQSRNRSYQYDMLGRLTRVAGGADLQSPNWNQQYV